jgi:hypothetical protein
MNENTHVSVGVYFCCVEPRKGLEWPHLKKTKKEMQSNELNPDHFVAEVDPELLCTVCLGVLQTARQCSNGHVYCLVCIQRSIVATGEKCPICLVHVSLSTLGVNRIADNLIGGLEIHCGDSRCDWRGTYRNRNQHHANDCMFIIVNCPNQVSGCASRLERMQMVGHIGLCQFGSIACPYCAALTMRRDLGLHEETCDMRSIACANGCGAIFLIKDQSQHNASCPEMMIQCTFFDHGCRVVGLKRKDLALHQSECASIHSDLIQQKLSGIESRFEAMLAERDQETQLLCEDMAREATERDRETQLLRQRCEVMETEARERDREMQLLRQRCEAMATEATERDRESQLVRQRCEAMAIEIGHCREVQALEQSSNDSSRRVAITWNAFLLPDSDSFSDYVSAHGEYRVRLKITLEKEDCRGLYLCCVGGSAYPVCISGSTFSVCGKTLTFNNTDFIRASGYIRGWPKAISASAIPQHLVDGRLVVTGMISLTLPAEPVHCCVCG